MSASRQIAPASSMRRIAVAIAWLASVAGAVLLLMAGRLDAIGAGGFGFEVIFAALAADVAVYASVGAILTLRRPGNRVGLVLMAAAALVVVTFLGFVLGAELTATRGQQDEVAGLASLLGVLGIYPTIIVAGPMVALVFPDGHLPGRVWRWPVRAIAAMVVVGSAFVVVRPGLIGGSFADNPFGFVDAPWLGLAAGLGESLLDLPLLCSLLLALAATIVRLRRARGLQREQLKWFVAANVAVLFSVVASSSAAAGPTVWSFLGALSLSLSPIAIGIAILRYRLYEIDRIISRTLAYTALTAALVVVYVGAFVALQAILAPLATSGGPVAVAASTLAVLIVFQPLRRRLQSAMDRRFNRSRYDAQRTVEAFAARLRDEVDLKRLSGEVQSVVGQALAPAAVSVWFRPTHRVS